MSEIKPLLRNPSVSDDNLIFAVGQASSSDQQHTVKLNKSKIRPRVNATEMQYEAESDLNQIPSKQGFAKENKSVEMLDLLTLVQKELSNLNADINTLKKAKKEVRDYRGEQKDKYMCKRCFEEKKKRKKDVVGWVILPESALQVRETEGDRETEGILSQQSW